MPLAIEVKNLTKVFKRGRGLGDYLSRPFRRLAKPNWRPRPPIAFALHQLNFSVPSGEIVAVLGPNGAGKTTLFKILSSVLLPDAGEVKICGRDILADPDVAKSLVGFVSGEERSFYWRLTACQNLEFFGGLHGFHGEELKKRIQDVASFFEIKDLDQRYPQYSTGMKFRLAFARCFLTDARVLLLDEPTRSLDYPTARHLRQFIKRALKRDPGLTALVATHHFDEAGEIADRLLLLHQGRAVGAGTVDELRETLGDPTASIATIYLSSLRGAAGGCDEATSESGIDSCIKRLPS